MTNDLKFDIYRLVKPKTPEDYSALLHEAFLILENLNEELDAILKENNEGS